MHVTHIMKVILIAGAERHLLTLLPALREGHKITSSIILLTEPDKPMQDMVALAQAHNIPIVTETIHGHFDASLPGRLRRAIRAQGPDIVHTHLLHADLYGVPVARSVGVQAVVTSRHNDNSFRRRLPMRLLHRGLWRMADEGVAISDAIREFCIRVEGARPAHIHTVRYGVEADALAQDIPTARAGLRAQLHLPPNAVIAGVMCRLIEQKGVSYALDAFAQVKDKHPSAHLVIAGDGALRAPLAGQAAELGLGGRVHFIGWQPEPLRTLAGYDVLLAPSLWEGFGLVFLEAMAQGLPIIATRVSAIPEVVADGETGLLVPPRDASALAMALERVLGDPSWRAQLGEAARQRLHTHFSAARMAAETAAVYARALAKT